MKITKQILKKLIKEELESTLNEAPDPVIKKVLENIKEREAQIARQAKEGKKSPPGMVNNHVGYKKVYELHRRRGWEAVAKSTEFEGSIQQSVLRYVLEQAQEAGLYDPEAKMRKKGVRAGKAVTRVRDQKAKTLIRSRIREYRKILQNWNKRKEEGYKIADSISGAGQGA